MQNAIKIKQGQTYRLAVCVYLDHLCMMTYGVSSSAHADNFCRCLRTAMLVNRHDSGTKQVVGEKFGVKSKKSVQKTLQMLP